MSKAGTEQALVLVVEDYQDAREMYAAYLQFSGYRVAEATDGLEAIEKAVQLMPDIPRARARPAAIRSSRSRACPMRSSPRSSGCSPRGRPENQAREIRRRCAGRDDAAEPSRSLSRSEWESSR